MNFLDAAVLRDGGDVIEVEVAGFGRAEVKKPARARFNGSGITIGAPPERLTLLFGADAGLNRVVAGPVVQASSYRTTIYSAIAVACVDPSVAVSFHNHIIRPTPPPSKPAPADW